MFSLLGTGWLGFPTAQILKQKGNQVNVSTTSDEKFETFKNHGLIPFKLQLSPTTEDIDALKEFLNTNTLIINIPPGKASDPEFHPAQIEFLKTFIEASPIQHVIYVSATSVYPENNKEAFEFDVNNNSESANYKLGKAEDIIRSLNKNTCILRYGGLIGGGRNLLKYFVGKENLEGGNVPVNLIHQVDASNILAIFAEKKLTGTFNICAPTHPTKKEFYTTQAILQGITPPQYNDVITQNFKIVNTEKLKQTIDYQFMYEDLLKCDMRV